MIAVPFRGHGIAAGVVSALDRSDGRPFTHDDLPRATHAVQLAQLSLAAAEEPTRAG